MPKHRTPKGACHGDWGFRVVTLKNETLDEFRYKDNQCC